MVTASSLSAAYIPGYPVLGLARAKEALLELEFDLEVTVKLLFVHATVFTVPAPSQYN